MTFSRLKSICNMIKVQHTLFNLPFVLASMMLAFKHAHRGTLLPDFMIIVFIILEVLAARNIAMTFNRIVDRKYDALNPRTRERELVTGKLSLRFAWIFLIFNAVFFIAFAYCLNSLCFVLSPFVLVIITGYSLVKRFSWLAHFALGLALGIGPIAGWIAVTGNFNSVVPFLLAAVVFLWSSGFDIIYSTLDAESDAREGLHSVPVRFGIRKALLIARYLHMGMFLVLILFLFVNGFNRIEMYVMLAMVDALLIKQHLIVSPENLKKVNQAFFTTNIVISFVVFAEIFFMVIRKG